MKRARFLTTVFCSLAGLIAIQSNTGLGGGSGGGGAPPSVHLESSVLLSLQQSSLKGDLIRITQPGAEPVYLRPNLDSMRTHSFRANTLPGSQETVFYSESQVEKMQTHMILSMMRSMKVSLGSLPVFSSDFKLQPKIEIDTIPEAELDKNPTI